jgi:F-type H+-transporting ATPase subunit delta
MGLAANRYAKAVLDFAEIEHESDVVLSQMKQLRNAFIQIPELTTLIHNPVVNASEKTEILKQAAGREKGIVLRRLLDLLHDKKRIEDILWIAIRYIELYNKRNDIHEVVLTTSTGLDANTTSAIVTWIEKEVKGTVVMSKIEDEKLLGGFILDVDCNRWDASLATSLKDLRKKLIS